jgi:hypothetical protein
LEVLKSERKWFEEVGWWAIPSFWFQAYIFNTYFTVGSGYLSGGNHKKMYICVVVARIPQFKKIFLNLSIAVYFVCKLKQSPDDFCDWSSIELIGLDIIWRGGGFLQPVHWLHQLRSLLNPFSSKYLKRVKIFNHYINCNP